MITEKWKIYKDTTWFCRGHRYEVSNLGRCRLDGELVEPRLHGRYLYFADRTVHRLVAELFIPNIENKPCVEHIDADCFNNRIDNLRWCNWKENNNNSITRERRSKSMTGKLHTEEHNKKISDSISGENHPWYGRHHTEESKDKQRKKAIERFSNKENHPMYGKHLSEEAKKLQSNKRLEFEEEKRKQGLKRKRIYDSEGKYKYIYVEVCQIS